MATGESISPREFCGSRAVWLGDSHKHSNCGEKAEATDGRVLHQSAHGRSERVGGVLGRGRRPAGSSSLRRTSDLVGDGGSPGIVACYTQRWGGRQRGVLSQAAAAACQHWRHKGRQAPKRGGRHYLQLFTRLLRMVGSTSPPRRHTRVSPFSSNYVGVT